MRVVTRALDERTVPQTPHLVFIKRNCGNRTNNDLERVRKSRATRSGRNLVRFDKTECDHGTAKNQREDKRSHLSLCVLCALCVRFGPWKWSGACLGKITILKIWANLVFRFHRRRCQARLYAILPRQAMLAAQRNMLQQLADRFRREPISSVNHNSLPVLRDRGMETSEAPVPSRVVRIVGYGDCTIRRTVSAGHRILRN